MSADATGYTGRMVCAICATRRPRRNCPGVHGDICAPCCGEGREITVRCPLDCEHLREARRHDKAPEIDVSQLPNRDIKVTEEFLESREELLEAMADALLQAALETEGVVDLDVRDALAALIRTYRSRASGIEYETRPENRLAAGLFDAAQEGIEEFRKQETELLGMPKTRDNDVLGLLVFLQNFEFDQNNGRPRSRAFLQALCDVYSYPAAPAAPPPSPLILP